MKRYSLLPVLLVLSLAGCNLSMSTTPPQSAVLNPYGVWNAAMTEYRWYNGNGQLISIDDFVRDTLGSFPHNPVKQSHYNGSNVLQWYELNQFQSFGGHWEMTQKRHFLPPVGTAAGVILNSQAWGYDALGDQVLSATYDYSDKTTGWMDSWLDTTAACTTTLPDGTLSSPFYRDLQNGTFGPSGVPGGYDVWDYSGAPTPSTWVNHVTLDGSLNYKAAESRTVDSQGRTADSFTYGVSSPGWTQVASTFDAAALTPYLKVWSTAPASPAPAAPSFLASPAPGAVLASADAGTVVSKSPLDTFAALTLPNLTTYPVKLVGFPALNIPATWTTTATEYYYTWSTGASVAVHFNASDLPTSVTYSAPGKSTIQVSLSYDSQGNLLQRTVTYGTSQVFSATVTRDSAERITEVDLTGSLMKIPLTYSLTYGSDTGSLAISSAGTALVTFDLAYNTTGTPAVMPFGLGNLTLDGTVQTLTVSLGGGSTKTPTLEMDLNASGATTSFGIYDVLGKNKSTRILRGQLSWTLDANQLKNSFAWAPASGTSWEYSFAWGTYAQMPSGITTASLQTGLDKALAAVDSFDFEKLLKPVSVLVPSLGGLGQQSANLIDQVKAAY